MWVRGVIKRGRVARTVSGGAPDWAWKIMMVNPLRLASVSISVSSFLASGRSCRLLSTLEYGAVVTAGGVLTPNAS